jgi:ATP-dependent protease ClpP protease subunit
MKKKLKPLFRASMQPGGTLELLVYEDIGQDWWSDTGVTAKNVKQQLDTAGIYSRIAVRINSPGGDAFEGVAIMNLLRAQRKPVDVFVDGIAASAASIIAMAGDTITMGKSSMMMVHNAWTVCMGDGDDMRKCAETLDLISSAIGEAYSDRSGKTAAEIKTIMDAETWMGAQECVDQGFATAVAEEDEEDDGQNMALAKSFKALRKLKNVPAALKPKAGETDACECKCGPCKDGNCPACDCTGCAAENCGSGACDCGNGAKDDDGDTMDSNLSQYEARLRLLRD